MSAMVLPGEPLIWSWWPGCPGGCELRAAPLQTSPLTSKQGQ